MLNNYTIIKIDILMLVALLLIFYGLIGIVLQGYRILVFFMCIELLWLSVNLFFIVGSLLNGTPEGFVMTLLVLGIVAGETAIGLAIVVNFYRIFKDLNLKKLVNLRM